MTLSYQEAKKLIEKVYDIWATGTIDQLSSVYDLKIEANYFGSLVGFPDIENRFLYMRKNHTNPRFTLHDLLIDGNKIALRSEYHAVTTQGEVVNSETVVILHLNDKGKVAKIWSMTNVPVDYLAKV
jgi:hypothetical protein